MENKTVFLLVSGDSDFGALVFSRNFDPELVYKQMLELEKKKITLFAEDEDLYVSIHEFSYVDPNFESFMINDFLDYDALKYKDFYRVEG